MAKEVINCLSTNYLLYYFLVGFEFTLLANVRRTLKVARPSYCRCSIQVVKSGDGRFFVSSDTQCSSLPSELFTSGITVQCTASNNIGSVCTFTCPRSGHVVRGIDGSLVCNTNGEWNVDVSTLNLSCEGKL